MSNPFKQFFNQLNNYSRSDRNALLILSALILVVIISNIIYSRIDIKEEYNSAEFEKLLKEYEDAFSDKNEEIGYFFKFDPNIISENKLDSLDIPKFIKRNILNYRKAGGKFYVSSDLKKIYGMNDSVFNLIETFVEIEKEIPKFSKPAKSISIKKLSGTFDPNKTNKEELRKFGFNNFQAQNILSYKNKGGVFKENRDLLKIYGIDSVFFFTIEKHIELVDQKKFVQNATKLPDPLIELNEADSLKLVQLNGIGPVYASRIIKYRKLLGGFYTKEQLLEIYNFPEETYRRLEKSVFVDSSLIVPIRINFAEYKDLLRHPYLNKMQVNALLKFREKNGSFEEVSDVEIVNGFSMPVCKRVLPYFTCR